MKKLLISIVSLAALSQLPLQAGPLDWLGIGKLTEKDEMLFEAIKQQNLEQFTQLLIQGANPNAKDMEGRTPIHAIIVNLIIMPKHNIVNISKEMIRVLAVKGTNLNSIDRHGLNPLDWAAIFNQDLAIFLLSLGANAQGGSAEWGGRDITPLHHAAKNGNAELVELLLQKGANVNAKAFVPFWKNRYYSPLDAAKETLKNRENKEVKENMRTIIKILENAGGKTVDELKQ